MAAKTVDILTDKFRPDGYVSNSGNSDYMTNGGVQRDVQAFLDGQSGLSTNGTYDPNAQASIAAEGAGISSSGDVGPGVSVSRKVPTWQDYIEILSLAYLDPTNVYNAQQSEIARDFTRSERESTQAFSSAEAAKAFERDLSADSTRYQRMMADLKAAGINPLYAFGSGGASAGSISSPAAAGSSSSGGSGAQAGTSSAKAVETIVSSIAKIVGLLVK